MKQSVTLHLIRKGISRLFGVEISESQCKLRIIRVWNHYNALPKNAWYECFFPEEQNSEENLNFAVRAILVLDKDEQDQLKNGEPYFINSDNLDNDTYTQIMEYLSDIGFDEEFANNLVDFSSGVEAESYVGNLQAIKDYLDA